MEYKTELHIHPDVNIHYRLPCNALQTSPITIRKRAFCSQSGQPFGIRPRPGVHLRQRIRPSRDVHEQTQGLTQWAEETMRANVPKPITIMIATTRQLHVKTCLCRLLHSSPHSISTIMPFVAVTAIYAGPRGTRATLSGGRHS